MYQKLLDIQKILAQIQREINKLFMNEQTVNGKKLLDFCLKNLGKSFGNQYIDVGCAEEVNSIANIVLGRPVGGGASTWLMGQALKDNTRFRDIAESKLLGGEIVIAITGTGNGRIVGHTGFFLGNGDIGSNDSADGKFKKNYTVKSFKDRYGIYGGFPIKYYRVL